GSCGDPDAHLQRQRPARDVVRPLRRTAGILAQVGVLLYVKNFSSQCREFLVCRHHPRARWTGHIGEAERRGGLPDAHAAEREPPQQLDGRDGVTLVLRDEVRIRWVPPAAKDLVAARLIAIEQQRLLVSGGEFENRYRRGLHIVDRVAQPPPSR